MKKLLIYSLSYLLLFSFFGTVYGDTNNRDLYIRANVPSLLEFKIITEVQYLDISKSDVRKEEKAVRNGTIVAIQTNSRDGYLISIQSLESEVFTSVTVQIEGDGRLFELLPGGTLDIHMPSSSIKQELIQFHYLFHLSDMAEKEKYPWPIMIGASPI